MDERKERRRMKLLALQDEDGVRRKWMKGKKGEG